MFSVISSFSLSPGNDQQVTVWQIFGHQAKERHVLQHGDWGRITSLKIVQTETKRTTMFIGAAWGTISMTWLQPNLRFSSSRMITKYALDEPVSDMQFSYKKQLLVVSGTKGTISMYHVDLESEYGLVRFIIADFCSKPTKGVHP
jgi:hypothetical protein